MKKTSIFMAIAFVLAVGSAFTTRNFISPVGKDPNSIPPNQCTAGTINQSGCLVQSGTQCTVTLPDAAIVDAFDGTCAEANRLKHN